MKQIQDDIISECADFKDWFDTYSYLMSQGKKLEIMDESLKTEENAIPGCQSTVWIHTQEKNGRLSFTADSDSMLVKGIIALLLRVVNHQSAEDIIDEEFYFIRELGLETQLSPRRSHGLTSVISSIKTAAQSTKQDMNTDKKKDRF
jgi:cysteine desulfuration protein SufE